MRAQLQNEDKDENFVSNELPRHIAVSVQTVTIFYSSPCPTCCSLNQFSGLNYYINKEKTTTYMT